MPELSLKLQWLLETVLYMCLVIGALLFVKQNVEEYLEGSTSFSISQEPISLLDLPTLVICYNTGNTQSLKGVYGKNLFLNAKLLGKVIENVTLKKDEIVQTSFGLRLKLTELRQSIVNPVLGRLCHGRVEAYDKTIGTDYQCYKITPLTNGNDTFDFGTSSLEFMFHYSNKSFTPGSFQVIATSEENSYGLAGGRWYDGKAECAPFVTQRAVIGIFEVTEYLSEHWIMRLLL